MIGVASQFGGRNFWKAYLDVAVVEAIVSYDLVFKIAI